MSVQATEVMVYRVTALGLAPDGDVKVVSNQRALLPDEYTVGWMRREAQYRAHDDLLAYAKEQRVRLEVFEYADWSLLRLGEEGDEK